MRKLRSINDKRLTWTLTAEPEEVSIEGNASAWGEPEDSEYAAKIRAQLDTGNEWAWCCVAVRVQFETETGEAFEGVDYLGCCSYRSERDFRRGGYLPQMREAAFDDLRMNMGHAIARGNAANSAFATA